MAVTVSAFRCGHAKTDENSAPNGAAGVICRTCKNARLRSRPKTAASRADDRARTAKHRGGPKGAFNGRKTACPEGHEYTPENTYLYEGTRQCKTCRKAVATAYYHSKRAAEGSHTEAQWQALCDETGNVCLACGVPRPLTRDHIVPVSLGGTNDISNIQPLCRPCNSAKGNRTSTDHRERVLLSLNEGGQ